MGFLTPAWHSLRSGWYAFLADLPAIAGALVVLVVFWLLGAVASGFLCNMARRYGRDESLGRAIGHMARFVIVLLGFLIAATIALPSVKPSDVLGFLGLGGVAVGFAFKDIFQNFLAGLLLLMREPFRLGDQICSGDYEGTVEDINLRATIIKTYSGERVIIPNSDVYSDAVIVRTAYGLHRDGLIVGIDYKDNIVQAKRAIMSRLPDVEGVLEEPAPWVRTAELAHNAINLEVFYWTKALHHETLLVRDRVAIAVYDALQGAGIGTGPHPD
jgi:small-conductance mechanosensitive channel